MALAYDNDGLIVNTTAGTGDSGSYSVGGSGNTLAVCVALFSVASNSVTAISYNSVGMTSAATPVEYNYTVNRYFNLEWYYLNSPATGSNTISTTYNSTTVASAVWLISFTGGNNGVGTNSGSSTGNDNNPGLTFTTDAATGIITAMFVMLGADTDPFTPDGSETERQDTDTGGGSTSTDFGIHCLTLPATGGSDTLSSTATGGGDHWLSFGIEINAAAAGGTAVPYYYHANQ